jgi:DNA-directed RNA polymerase specialized sigma24 family protein
MKLVTLTPEQRQFAEEQHGLVAKFLRYRRLPESDFYDIVIFGFLKAVVEYREKPSLREKYKFSTIANRKMRDTLYTHYIWQNRQMRRGGALSLNAEVYADGDTLALQDTIAAPPDSLLLAIETTPLLRALAERISPREMELIRMKLYGYRTREISQLKHITMKNAADTVAGVYDTALDVCAA